MSGRGLVIAVAVLAAGCDDSPAPPAVAGPAKPLVAEAPMQPMPSPAVAKRVDELIASISMRAASEQVEETGRAIAELVKIGPPAVPQIVAAITRIDLNDPTRANGVGYGVLTLNEMGPVAVGPVRAAWGKLDEADRWKLMPFRGKHDYAAALPFALATLAAADQTLLGQAIDYLGEYRERKARGPLIRLLDTAAPRMRWPILDALARIGGEEAVDVLTAQLTPNSWAAKGDGLIAPPGLWPPWWPDGRPKVIALLHTMRAGKARGAMLAVLEERGPGRAYLGSFIIAYLADHGDLESVPVLRRIVASPRIEPSLDGPQEVKTLATDAINRITRRAI